MSFRLRISLVFVLLVGIILGLFGSYLYVQSDHIRAEEFYQRLDERAALTERFVREAGDLPLDEADHLERTLLAALPNEALAILTPQGKVVFQRADPIPNVPKSWIASALDKGSLHVSYAGRQYVVRATNVPSKGGTMVTLASASDVEGGEQLDQLQRSVILGSVLLLLVTGVIAWGFATWTLIPVRILVRTANEIQEPTQRIPIPPGPQDELGSIATTFNALLARIEAAFQVQRSFIASASHELRTPLTVVRGELHQALQLAHGQDELIGKLRTVESQALHMQDLLAQLLWLARTQGPLENITTDEVRLDEVAERAMERCRARYPERNVHFDMADDEEGKEPLVRGNAVLLTAALYNLLTNAAKYGGESVIYLLLQATGNGWWSISVSDTGPGMSEEVLSRVREMFYRSADASRLDGHGIGLALVDRIAHVHHGRLDIVTAPGKGTSATLVLPAIRA